MEAHTARALGRHFLDDLVVPIGTPEFDDAEQQCQKSGCDEGKLDGGCSAGSAGESCERSVCHFTCTTAYWCSVEGRKPKLENMGVKAREAAIVTNIPAMPGEQLVAQLTAFPQVQERGEPVGQ
jgi:hypothetical protein